MNVPSTADVACVADAICRRMTLQQQLTRLREPTSLHGSRSQFRQHLLCAGLKVAASVRAGETVLGLLAIASAPVERMIRVDCAWFMNAHTTQS